MYPRISDLFIDLFGFQLPIPIYSFGFMVAVAILTASWLLSLELRRMYAEGRVGSVSVPDSESKKRRARKKQVPPTELVGTITVLAAVTGVVGAKIFHIFENFGQFLNDPVAMLFSTGGLTFYGGLILAAFVVGYYVQKNGIHVWNFYDAVAPGMMAAYGIGRIGCHLAGDGDWGIASNMALKPDWLPTWLWAETYPNNILGVTLPEPGVYPTPIYEFVAAMILFGLLWAVRRHPFKAGWLFSLYLVFSGIERLLIEQIRVNVEFSFLGMMVTQAEVISTLLIVAGIVGLFLTSRRREPEHVPQTPVVGTPAAQ